MQILGDHARFIHDSLAPAESREIERASQFISTFDGLLKQARQPLTANLAMALAREAIQPTGKLREFKLHLLRRHLLRELGSTLPPTFYNHMVNELEECQRVLSVLSQGEKPSPGHAVHQHLLWLPDASGHAGSLRSSVDLVERSIQAKCDAFTHDFDMFHLKAVELAGYLRAHIDDFPALRRFNEEVSLEVSLFHGFLKELEEMELDNQLLGSISALMPDHMAREECYYLKKLGDACQSVAIPPSCDPTQPRVRDPRIKQEGV
jgi:hypothetical protein